MASLECLDCCVADVEGSVIWKLVLHSKIVILILRKKILVSSKKLLETSKIILVSIVRILF
jgi:hypothetical protein